MTKSDCVEVIIDSLPNQVVDIANFKQVGVLVNQADLDALMIGSGKNIRVISSDMDYSNIDSPIKDVLKVAFAQSHNNVYVSSVALIGCGKTEYDNTKVLIMTLVSDKFTSSNGDTDCQFTLQFYSDFTVNSHFTAKQKATGEDVKEDLNLTYTLEDVVYTVNGLPEELILSPKDGGYVSGDNVKYSLSVKKQKNTAKAENSPLDTKDLDKAELENPGQFFLFSSALILTEEELYLLDTWCLNNERGFVSHYTDYEKAKTFSDNCMKTKEGKQIFMIADPQAFIGIAFACKVAVERAGNLTAKFKSLVGFVSTAYDYAKRTEAKSKFINLYFTESRYYSFITEGYMIGGEWFDFFFGKAYLKALSKNDLTNLLNKERKIDLGFNDASKALIISTINATLDPFVENNFLDPDITVTIPKNEDIPTESFNNRILDVIRVKCYFVQKLHFIKEEIEPALNNAVVGV